jgi:hypothetical protein
MDLDGYEQIKFALAEVLREAALARNQSGEAQDEPIRDVFENLAEDDFNVAAVERFSRGKSSLMNAISRVGEIVDAIADAERKRELQKRLVDIAGRVESVGEITSARGAKASRPAVMPCEVCVAIEEACYATMAKVQYDLINNEQKRREWAKAGGFCRAHAWAHFDMASSYGMAIAYPPLLDALAKLCREVAAGGADPETLRAISGETHGPCPICQVAAAAESAMLQEMTQPSVPEAETFPSLCLHHCVLLAPRLNLTEAKRLMAHQADMCNLAAANMRRYALLWNAVRRDLAEAPENGAAKAGVAFTVGGRRMPQIIRDGRTRRDDPCH